ncbi:FG-GAP repeat domain-containing protein [Streptomyces sp. NPDC057833]|uniref:FG-GAP repeat domain-containing protein n=1 Tax=unclassified Streptomyces TaxID=2593676 RepID=UPI0036C1848B
MKSSRRPLGACTFHSQAVGARGGTVRPGRGPGGFKKIVGAGDLNGDGIGDLVAQDTSNNLYRYYGTGTGNGTFGARTKVFSSWGGSYDVVVGVGDITGDGKADLVSRDSAGTVWCNNGDGKGSFGSRAKIATGWQGY